MANDFIQAIKVSSREDYALCLEIRRAVFIDEQGVNENVEIDSYEKESIHFLVKRNDKAVSTGRFRLKGNLLKFERIATLSSARGKGMAAKLIEKMQSAAFNEFPEYLQFMHAQEEVVSFYERLGWKVIGESFEEAGIRHRMMIFIPVDFSKIKKLKCLEDPNIPKSISSYLKKKLSKDTGL